VKKEKREVDSARLCCRSVVVCFEHVSQILVSINQGILGPEADYSSIPSFGVKNRWRYTSIPAHVSVALTGTSLP